MRWNIYITSFSTILVFVVVFLSNTFQARASLWHCVTLSELSWPLFWLSSAKLFKMTVHWNIHITCVSARLVFILVFFSDPYKTQHYSANQSHVPFNTVSTLAIFCVSLFYSIAQNIYSFPVPYAHVSPTCSCYQTAVFLPVSIKYSNFRPLLHPPFCPLPFTSHSTAEVNKFYCAGVTWEPVANRQEIPFQNTNIIKFY